MIATAFCLARTPSATPQYSMVCTLVDLEIVRSDSDVKDNHD